MWLVWTSLVWAAIFGGFGSQVVGYLMNRAEYRHWVSAPG